MNDWIADLFDHEKQMLFAALRRDMRSELLKAESNAQHADYHLTNHRITVRILEVLNPRKARQV
jgi:hypothetical protein